MMVFVVAMRMVVVMGMVRATVIVMVSVIAMAIAVAMAITPKTVRFEGRSFVRKPYKYRYVSVA